MIKSMTGFGKGQYSGGFGKFIVEARSVNHRFLELTNKLPQDFYLFDDIIKSCVQKWIKRGKVNISIVFQPNKKLFQTFEIDKEAARRYFKLLDETNRAIGLKESPSLAQILSFPEVIIQKGGQKDMEQLWPKLKIALDRALFLLDNMRKKEGEELYRDISRRIKKIGDLLLRIKREAPVVVSSYKVRLEKKLKELADIDAIDKDRLALEISIFAKGCDITEELTRSFSHIKGLKKALISNQEAGRRLDFTIVELQREINTLGQKAGSYFISDCAIKIKSEIEKIREQVQNVE